MKNSIFIFAAIAVISFTACNNESQQSKEVKKEEKHDTHDGHKHQEGDGHQHDSTHSKDVDTLGMKIGGNELDSKKK